MIELFIYFADALASSNRFVVDLLDKVLTCEIRSEIFSCLKSTSKLVM